MKGYFDEKSLEAYNLLIADREGVDFSEGEIYDFTRCVRADGSFYGTSGRCRQGSPAGPKEEAEKTGRQRTRSEKSARSKDDDVSFPSDDKKSLSESRKAMRHHREQMDIHSKKIAELNDAGKRIPKSLQDKLDKARSSYNTHRKEINDATGVMKRPVMQEARELGRKAEKEAQEKRAKQRGMDTLMSAIKDNKDKLTGNEDKLAKVARSRIDNLNEEMKRSDADKPFIKSEITRLERTAKELERRAQTNKEEAEAKKS